MEARIIGPAAELGDVSNGVDFYGAHLTREWSDVNFGPEDLAKAKGNRFIEVRGHGPKDEDPEEAKANALEETELKTVRARLGELGVDYHHKEKLATLQGKLDKAEKAKKAADEEAADDLAAAQARLGDDSLTGA